MPLRKTWTWVGVFGPDLMLCVARVRVGGLRRAWWAVWDGARLWEGGPRGVRVDARRAQVDAGEVRIGLALDPGRSIEVTTGPAWTRKTPVLAHGLVVVGGRRVEVAAPGLVDESDGRHPRHTAWRWAAGAGVTAAGGAAVAWNLVEGMHDGSPSERCVWVDGEPHAVGPLAFDGLDGVGDLRFSAVAKRAARESYVVLRSDYEQPFGSFAGELPVAGPVRGRGVMERHEARW
jgi:hypothetical protein